MSKMISLQSSGIGRQRVKAFDTAAAKDYAVIVAARTWLGQPISTEDAQIAAIALASGLTVATRNIKDFENIDGLLLANPWQGIIPHQQPRKTPHEANIYRDRHDLRPLRKSSYPRRQAA